MTLYILIDGQVHGPYSLEEVSEHLAQGTFLSSDLVRTSKEKGEWIPLSTVLPDLIESPDKATPSRPPLHTKRKFSYVVWLGIALTFVGVLSLMAAGLAVFLLLPMIVQSPLFRHQAPSDFTSSYASNMGDPPVLVADFNAASENDWLATLITREMCSQAYLGIAPGQPIPANCFGAQALGATAPQLNILAPNWPSGAVSKSININFIWDPQGYAQFAQLLVSPNSHPNVDPRAATILTDLLKLTGPNLAGLDVEVSANLGKDVLNPRLHEDAALLLCALAWRENAGGYSDTRQLLCRATAHLALAKALSSNAPSWNYRIAETALKVFAGREADSIAQISELRALPDCPPGAQIWLICLEARILEDWRVLNPNGSSSLLEKITWAQLLCLDLNSTVAVDKLGKAGISDVICDFGRAVTVDPPTISVENGQRFCENTLGLEFIEIADLNQIEKGKEYTSATLPYRLSEPESETVTFEESSLQFHVIGMKSFQNAARRHLLNEFWSTYYWMEDIGGVQYEAESFRIKINDEFRHLLGREYVDLMIPFIKNLRDKRETLNVSQIPVAHLYAFSSDYPSYTLLLKFYGNGLPWGTAFDAASRRQDLFVHDPYNEILSAPKVGFMNNSYVDIAALHPSCYRLLQAGNLESSEYQLKTLSPFLDYNLHAYNILDDGHSVFPEKLRETLLIRRAVLDPDTYFSLGGFYVKQGLPDKAADAFRKGVNQAIDQVEASNNIAWLLQYDLDHNNLDEAKELADKAADTYSEAGLAAHYTVALKLNQPDVAEQDAKNIQSRYGDAHYLRELYHKRADYFPGKYDLIIAVAFPSGLRKVSLLDFSNSTPPSHGVVMQYRRNEVPVDPSLMDRDVVVAVNGIKIDTRNQLFVYCDQLDEPRMELIVWRVNQYIVVETHPPNHYFGVDLFDYIPIHI